MSDNDLLAKIARARRRVFVVQEQLELAKAKLATTDAAMDVSVLKAELRYAKGDLGAMMDRIDRYYQPELLARPGDANAAPE